MKKFSLLLIFIIFILSPQIISARTTPEDIINAQRAELNLRIKNYSPASKQKLDLYSQKITDLNKKITDDLEQNMLRQGQILDEYIKRNNITEDGGKDGIHRNLAEPVANARYWLTYAHEAVAYQAAQIYIFNLTSESNINSDILSQINILQSDINILAGKVAKSQNIISGLIK